MGISSGGLAGRGTVREREFVVRLKAGEAAECLEVRPSTVDVTEGGDPEAAPEQEVVGLLHRKCLRDSHVPRWSGVVETEAAAGGAAAGEAAGAEAAGAEAAEVAAAGVGPVVAGGGGCGSAGDELRAAGEAEAGS